MNESWLDAVKGNAPGRLPVAAKQPGTGNRLTPAGMIGDVDVVQIGSKRGAIARHSGRDNYSFAGRRAQYSVSANPVARDLEQVCG